MIGESNSRRVSRATLRTGARALVLVMLAIAALIAPATRAVAQGATGPESQQLREARLASSLDRETLRDVLRIIGDARRQGLPDEPLYDKALQGGMRRAPSALIVSGVRKVAVRLDSATKALAPNATTGELMAGAEALAVRVPTATLRKLRIASPKRSVEVPLGVLTQLVSNNVPVEHASELVLNMIAKGAPSAQIVALGANIEDDIAAGIPPMTSIDVRAKGIGFPLSGAVPAGITPTTAGDFAPGVTGTNRTGQPARPRRP